MARRTTRTTQETPPTPVDKIEALLTALNTIEGINFMEDAWIEKAPANYGVVEVTGEIGGDHADGRKVAQAVNVRITIYVSGGSHAWLAAVQSVLDAQKLPYTFPQREYLQDIHKVTWVWNTRMRTPLIYTPEAVGNG